MNLRRSASPEEVTVSDWQPIETAPHNVAVLLYCPERCVSNRERIELGCASFGVRGQRSAHSWATHWMPLPNFPTPQPSDEVDG
jgi:hypothetical protein